MGYAQHEKQFFWTEITKADHWFSETFHFIKISYGLVKLGILSNIFCQESVTSS